MSRENVKVVPAGLDAWNAGDMVALRDFYAPDLVVHSPENWPEPGPFVGLDAAMRQFEQVRAAWDADRLNLVEGLVDAGDRVVGRLIWEGLGHGPAAAMEALEAVGLRE